MRMNSPGENDTISQELPCFWLGKDDSQALQIHLPSNLPNYRGEGYDELLKLNGSRDGLCDWFCRPARLNFLDFKPKDSEILQVLETDFDQKPRPPALDEKETEDNRDTDGGANLKRGEDSPGIHQHDGLVIQYNTNANSAIELCRDSQSEGHDFVNMLERKFCRMSDKSLWSLCTGEQRDHCCSVDSKQLVVNGKTLRGAYATVNNWGLL